jgi:hypothetical protein
MRSWLFGSKDVAEDRSDRGMPQPDSMSGTSSTAGPTGGQDGSYPGPGSERGGRPGTAQGGRVGQS